MGLPVELTLLLEFVSSLTIFLDCISNERAGLEASSETQDSAIGFSLTRRIPGIIIWETFLSTSPRAFLLFYWLWISNCWARSALCPDSPWTTIERDRASFLWMMSPLAYLELFPTLAWPRLWMSLQLDITLLVPALFGFLANLKFSVIDIARSLVFYIRWIFCISDSCRLIEFWIGTASTLLF